MKIKMMAACSLALASLLGTLPAQAKGKKVSPVITDNVEFAAKQVQLMVDTMDTFDKIRSPRTTDKKPCARKETAFRKTKTFLAHNRPRSCAQKKPAFRKPACIHCVRPMPRHSTSANAISAPQFFSVRQCISPSANPLPPYPKTQPNAPLHHSAYRHLPVKAHQPSHPV